MLFKLRPDTTHVAEAMFRGYWHYLREFDSHAEGQLWIADWANGSPIALAAVGVEPMARWPEAHRARPLEPEEANTRLYDSMAQYP